MAMTIKTLGLGLLKKAGTDVAYLPGSAVLYAAPRPGQFQATERKTALVTAMRFYNSGPDLMAMHVQVIRYDEDEREIRKRQPTFITPISLKLNPGELKVDTTPLVLEDGDVLAGSANTANLIHYVISGVEQGI
jgi:hypothetical protein